MEAETYQYRPAKNDNGTFFYTDCGNQMYVAENNPMRYHGKLCPKCLSQGRHVTLYLRGTNEAWNRRASDDGIL